MHALDIDPNRPSPQVVAAHNMKVAKANLACELAKALMANPNVIPAEPEIIVHFVVGVAEGIIETFTLMSDSAGNRGGLTS